MSIQITCPCGKRGLIPEKYGGRTVRCPDCQNLLKIPRPQDTLEVAELVEEVGDHSASAVDSPSPKAPKSTPLQEAPDRWRERAKELFLYPQSLSRKAVKRALREEGLTAKHARQVIEQVLGQWKAQVEDLLRTGKRPSPVRRQLIDEEKLSTREAKRIVDDVLRDLASRGEQPKSGLDRFFSKLGVETAFGHKRTCYECLLRGRPESRNRASFKCKNCDIDLCTECSVSKDGFPYCPKCRRKVSGIYGPFSFLVILLLPCVIAVAFLVPSVGGYACLLWVVVTILGPLIMSKWTDSPR